MSASAEWQFLTDDESTMTDAWDGLSETAAEFGAGVVSSSAIGHFDDLLALCSVAVIDGIEVAVHVNVDEKTIVWATRPASPSEVVS